MLSRTLRILSLMSLVFAFLVASQAQEKSNMITAADKYVISAEAGGINYTEGIVTVTRVNGTGGTLMKGDRLMIGDRASTGPNGRAEILLNPGSYVRLGPNSEFEFKTTSLDDLKLKFNKGSALLEVFATSKFKVNVFTPTGRAILVESGVYRVDLAPSGSWTLSVVEGKAFVGAPLVTLLTEGKMAAMGNGPVTVTKFDRGKRDELAEWSRSRSKGLAKMTASLKNNTVRDSLFSGYNGGHWGFYNSFGLWVYNPFSFTYCFLPFGRGWYSPYGWGYGMGLYWYDFRPYYRDPQYNPVPLPPTPQGELGKRKPVEDLAPPPFTQLQRQQYGDLSRRDYNNSNNNGGGGGGFYDSGRRESSGDRTYNSGDINRSSSPGMSPPVRSSQDAPPPPAKRDKPIDY